MSEEEQDDLDDEIIEHEIKFDRQTMIAHVCELKEYLILSTKSDNRIVIVNKQFQVAKIIASRIKIASLSLVDQSSKYLFAATDTGTLKCYEANKLLSKTPTSVDFYTPEQDIQGGSIRQVIPCFDHQAASSKTPAGQQMVLATGSNRLYYAKFDAAKKQLLFKGYE